MCGLAGVAGLLDKKEDVQVFRQLLILNSLRGEDSTGVAGLSRGKDAEVEVFKSCVPSYDFVDFNKVKEIIISNDKLLMGHCRWKTVGDKIKANAQPFDMVNITGTHNGTLSFGAKYRLEGRNTFGTDSEALYYHIDKFGFSEAAKQLDVKDALALVWYNKDEDKLYMYRNELRPLYYTYSEDRKRIIWASEAGMLYLVLNRLSVKFDKVHLVKENHLYSWDMPKLPTDAFAKAKLEQVLLPAVRGVPKRKLDNFFEGCDGLAKKAADSARVFNQTAGPVIGGTDILDFSRFRADRMITRRQQNGGNYYTDYNGNKLDREQFDTAVASGCCVCGCTPAWGEPVKFLKDGNHLCYLCLAEGVRQYKEGQGDKSPCNILLAFT